MLSCQTTREEEELARAIAESCRMADEAAAHAPALLSGPRPLSEVADEYSSGGRAELYAAKVAFLGRIYASFRRVRGELLA